MSVKNAAIIGAGIAGLTAALALSRRGIACDIVEQAGQFAEVGAGLQVSPNASRILGELGVLADIEAVWQEPDHIGLASGTSLRSLATVPAGSFARRRWGAPYGVLHRATLQQALLKSVLRNPLCRLHQGRRLELASPAVIADVTGVTPDVIIGADGVWSKVRSQIPGGADARFSGNIAWRFIVPNDLAPSFLDKTNVTAYLGPTSHLVCYPLREARSINVVAITTGTTPGETWNAENARNQRPLLDRHFANWNSEIGALLQLTESPTYWPLYEVGSGRWHNGRDTILIGDAAHAMMPFAAQGAAMAIEDAFELGGLLAALPLPHALGAYEARRKPRIDHLRKRGAFNKFAYHARGPFRLGRDLVLSLRPPQSLAADLDWIYGYKAAG